MKQIKRIREKKARFLMGIVVLWLLCMLGGCQNPAQGVWKQTKAYESKTAGSQAAEKQNAENGNTENGNIESGNAGNTSAQHNSAEEQEMQTVRNENTVPEVKEPAISMQAVDETVYITASTLNIRKGASTDSEIAVELPYGSSIQRIGYSDSWSKVVWNGGEYYAASRYLSATQPKPQETAAQTAKTGDGIGTKTSGGEKGIMIAIDAGHQAKGNSQKEPDGPGSSTMKAKVSSGTAGVSTGIAEYKLNLAVSLKLKEELVSRGYDVYMVREIHEVDLSNAERAKMANESGADIFIRVHANSLSNSSVRGTLTMCMTKKNPYNSALYEKSQKLSKKIVDGVCAQTGFKNRGIQETDTMSGINWCEIPVTIVEMGFMSNAEEDRLMATEEYRNKIAKGIADGIDAYYAD